MSGAERGTDLGGRRPRFRYRGLKVQIVLWTVLPLTLVLIGVAFTGVYSHEQSMRVLVDERNRGMALATAAQVRDLLNTRAQALQALAIQDSFRHGDVTARLKLLSAAGTFGDLFVEPVALLDLQGQALTSAADPSAWTQTHGQSLANAVMRRQGTAVTTLSDSLGRSSIVVLGVPLYGPASAVDGVLAGLVSLASAEFDALLREAVVGATGIVYLVGQTGEVLTSSVSPQLGQAPSLEGHTGIEVCLQDSEAGATFCQAPDGAQMTLAYAPVLFADAGWRVIIRQPWAEVIGPVLRYSQLMPLVAALAAIVSLLTLYYGVRAIAQPLQAVGRQAERVAWGDFDATSTPVGGVEEIEDLRRTLDMMAKRIRTYQDVMHSYIGAITRGQEEERRRLARELHDDTTQALIALGQQLEKTHRLLPEQAELAAEHLKALRADLVHIVDDIRRFSRDLRPTYLEDLGFIPALEMLTRKADQEGPLSVHFAVAGRVRRLPADLELACYRIVQEALNNVAQHAKAAHAWLEVHFEAQQVVLTIRDDGEGFETPDLPDTLAEQGHFGLVGVRERTLLYNGHLAIHSAPGEGTVVTVQLPYPS